MSAMDTSEDSPGISAPGVIVSDVQSSSGLSISV
jgi:hypothetical protein